MRFGEVKAKEALGMILAHSAKGAAGRISKGTVLEEEHVESLAGAGVESVAVAMPEEGDVGEDEAARRVAEAMAGEGIRVGGASSGRANLFAEEAGLLRVDAARVDALNAIDPAVTLATLPDREHVEVGRLAATLKVIPYAVAGGVVEACERAGPALLLRRYVPRRARLVQTRLASTPEAMLDKTRRITEARLARCRAELAGESRCEHEAGALAGEMRSALADGPDILLVSGASAVSDGRDVIPAAIGEAGGEVRSVGMPVDPGNLLVLGRVGETAVIGLPGCARSPKLNGLDWILRRLCAGESVGDEDVRRMGVGGLLDEIHDRPRPRAPAAAPGPLAAILLAAGLSSRMGDANKLLEEWRGKPLLAHALGALESARDGGVVAHVAVVTGNDRDAVARLVRGRGFGLAHNERYRSGMASSLAAGVASLPEDCAGAFVCLGDMPLVAAEHLAALKAAFDPAAGKDIVVPVRGGRRGHPVLFGARHFAELAALEGDAGARPLLGRHEESVAEVEAGPEAMVDLDEPAAFAEHA